MRARSLEAQYSSMQKKVIAQLEVAKDGAVKHKTSMQEKSLVDVEALCLLAL